MIRVQSLSARFGGFRLRDITLRVDAGLSLAVLGPSGAGKSLLLETVLGLRRMQQGRVLIDGRDVSRLPPERRDASYLPQDVALFPHLSVRKNILFGARSRRFEHGVDREIQRLAELLNVAHLLDRRDVTSLSGGEAQRVALARALLVRPRILFLDECFNSVDAPLRRRLRVEFRQLQRLLDLTVLLVTHDHEEAFLLADQVALLMDGRLVQVDTPERLYARPASVRAARFLGIENILPLDHLEIGDSQAVCHVGPLRLVAPPPVDSSERFSHVGFGDEEIRLLDHSDSQAVPQEPNTFWAKVRSAVNLGRRWHLRLQVSQDHGPTLSCTVPRFAADSSLLQPDQAVTVHVDRSSIRLLGECENELRETTTKWNRDQIANRKLIPMGHAREDQVDAEGRSGP